MVGYLHYKCEVDKLGTAATGNFLCGKRKKVETPNQLNLKKGGGGSWRGWAVERGGADTLKAWVAQLVLYNLALPNLIKQNKNSGATHFVFAF
jgi:hypothetical protein